MKGRFGGSSSFPRLSILLLLLSTPVARAFQIGPLLSTCIDACQRGCDEIRTVQEQRQSGGGASDLLQAELKDADDSRSVMTIADQAAQRAILCGLRETWGDELHLVGEEDDDDDDDEADSQSKESRPKPPLRKDMMDDDIGETADLDPASVTIFVDPLDGTREFVEGRLENCQVLVGIAIDGEAVAGVIGIPFPKGKEDTATAATIVYGMVDVGSGTIGTPLTRGPFPLERNIDGVKSPRPHHATGSSPAPVVASALGKVISQFGGSNVVYGGAGNKILAAALGEVACSLQHKVGGPWDLCAPEAVAKAMGAGITDFFGNPIDIYNKDGPGRGTEKGYLVSAPGSDHNALVATVLASDEVREYRKSLEEE